ncbi:PEPxxWA-CTERM sorting domain-containing protein [Sphingomonas sp. AP4-R1]|nr:PEPxxWA-CTERM sorting domain-containing protein [Sphingomonas sp. AP4-R1]
MMALAPFAAQATVVTFDGGIPGGTDPLGGTYVTGPSGGGLVQFQETAGHQADDTQQVLFDPTGSGLANATSFTLTITGSTDMILPLDRNFGNYFETFAADGSILSVWNASVNAAGTAITYTADAGSELLAGERFATITTFSQGNDLPADFSYTLSWTGDAAAAVPEAATWMMMILGFGLVGLSYRRKPAAVRFAA